MKINASKIAFIVVFTLISILLSLSLFPAEVVLFESNEMIFYTPVYLLGAVFGILFSIALLSFFDLFKLHMKDRVVIITLLLCIAIIISTFLYVSFNRYTVTGTNAGVIYKTDKLTGQTWFIVRDKQIAVKNKPQ